MPASPDNTAERPVIQGPSFPPFVRVAGAFCFLGLNPLFIWVWLDHPKFVQGPIDFPEVFMAIVTVGMLTLGCWGIAAAFAKTRVYERYIEWGVRRRRLLLTDIAHVDSPTSLRCTVFLIPLCRFQVLRLVRKDGKRIEIPGGTRELGEFFGELAARYPRP